MKKIFCALFICAGLPVWAGNAFDVRGNAIENTFHIGLEISGIANSETGLDSSKGSYSASNTLLGGGLIARYDIDEFYLQAGLGASNLMAQKVNELSIDMTGRTQWHIPFYAYAFYKLHRFFGAGTGFSHITETTLCVDGTPAPDSSFHHIFLDIAGQFQAKINDAMRMHVTLVTGVNLIPGRQNVYTIGDLLHLRFQANIGATYAVF